MGRATCRIFFALWLAAPALASCLLCFALQPSSQPSFAAPPLFLRGSFLGRRNAPQCAHESGLPGLPLLRCVRAHPPATRVTAMGGRSEELPGSTGDLFKQAAADLVVAKAARENQGAVWSLLEAGQTNEAVRLLVHLCLQGQLDEGDMVKLWRGTNLQPQAIAEALEEGALSGKHSPPAGAQPGGGDTFLCHEVEQAYGLTSAAKVLGLMLGHTQEALRLLSTAHQILAVSGGRSSDGETSDDPGRGESLAFPALSRQAGDGGMAEEMKKRKGEQGMKALVGVSVAHAAVLMRGGDYKGAYEKQTTAVALLNLLAQAVSPTSTGESAGPAADGRQASASSGTSGNIFESQGIDTELAEQVVVQAVMARELGLFAEAELICRRALLALSLKHSVAEPKIEAKNVEQDWWDELDVSSPYRSFTRSATLSGPNGADDGSCGGGELLAGKEGSSGAGSLEVAGIRSQLGLVYLAQANFDHALLQMRQVMHMLANAVGEKHPRTLDAMHQVGVVLQAQGRHGDAAEMHQHALARREESFGVDSAEAAHSLVHLANAREAQGMAEEALGLRRRRLDMALRHYPPGHPQIAEARMEVAGSRRVMGMWKEAKEELNQAHEILVTNLGWAHPKVAVVVGNLATLAEEEGEYDKSILLHQQSLALKKKTLGDEHFSVSTTLVNMARVHQKLDDLDAAIALRQQALAIAKQSLGEEHPQIAVMLNNMGVIEMRRQRYSDASQLVQQALDIDEKAFGPQHPQVASDLNTLGTLAFHCGEKQLSRQLFERAWKIRRQHLGDLHARTLASKKNLDMVSSILDADEAQ